MERNILIPMAERPSKVPETLWLNGEILILLYVVALCSWAVLILTVLS